MYMFFINKLEICTVTKTVTKTTQRNCMKIGQNEMIRILLRKKQRNKQQQQQQKTASLKKPPLGGLS